MAISGELDKIQTRLHDDGELWTRAELLRWWNDGYRELLAQSTAVRKFVTMDLPGRFTYSRTYAWEDRHVRGGTEWQAAYSTQSSDKAVTYQWESEHLEGVTPTNSLDGITQQWERAYSDDTNHHYLFGLPRNSERIKRLAWNNRKIFPVVTGDLDALETGWWRKQGEPQFWTLGVGKNRQFEIFAIQTSYVQGYALNDYSSGIPRQFSGRTYTAASQEKARFSNGYAFSTSGDLQALTHDGFNFQPGQGYTNDFESAFVSGFDAYRFTWYASTDSNDAPDLTYSGTQPWEIYNRGTGRTLGIYSWEVQNGATLKEQSDQSLGLAGLGRRFTRDVSDSDSSFAVHVWEEELLEGETSFTASSTIGTYQWEEIYGAQSYVVGVGTIRRILSASRQYLAGHSVGAARRFGTSTSALLAHIVIIPELDLAETETPLLMPQRLLKYIRFFVLSRAFGRQGEGQRLNLAAHYLARFNAGAAFFRRFTDLAAKDRHYVRKPIEFAGRRPPRPKLPSTFPRISI